METVGRMRRVILFALPAALMILHGCSGSEETGAESSPPEENSQAQELARRRALRHFIDGSLMETKGEYAQAILEYQDALRYDRENHAIYFALSKCYSRLDKPAPAIETARKARKLSPENIDYLRNLGDIYAAAYQLDSAAAVYEQVVRRDTTDIQAWFTLASLYQSRKPLKALEVYEGIIDRFGPEWEVLIQIAELSNLLGETGKAIRALEELQAMDPGNLELRRSLAQAHVRAQEYDKAVLLYEDLRERDPDNLDFLGELATVHLLQYDYRKAAELFDLVLARDTVSVESKLQIGEAYFSQMQSDSTLIPVTRSLFVRIRDRHPEDWRPYWFLGALGGISGNDSAVVENFSKVTELASWNPDGWVYLSTVYLQREEYDEVVRILEEGSVHVPENYLMSFYLGVAYHQLGRNAEALNSLDKATKIDPTDLRAVSQLGLIYDEEKMYAESDSLYDEALKIEPENYLILNNYAYSLADRSVELERALEMATRAVEANPENPSYLDTIGWIYFRLEQYDEAEHYISQAIEKGEPNAVVHEHLGDVFFMTDQKERALEQWSIALDLDKDNDALKQKIARGGL